jgi:hypothetical protein
VDRGGTRLHLRERFGMRIASRPLSTAIACEDHNLAKCVAEHLDPALVGHVVGGYQPAQSVEELRQPDPTIRLRRP